MPQLWSLDLDISKEERIPLGVLLDTILVVLLRIIFFPRTHGIDMLVTLIPTSIYHFACLRLVVETFKLIVRYLDRVILFFFFVLSSEGIVG